MIPEIYRGLGGSEVRYLSRGLRVREIFADIPATTIPGVPATIIPGVPATTIPAVPGQVLEPASQGTGWIGYHGPSGERAYPRISNPFSVSANLVNAGGALIAMVPAGGSVVLTYGRPNAAANPGPGEYGIYARWVRHGGALVSPGQPAQTIPEIPPTIIPGIPPTIIPGIPSSRFLSLGIAASGAATAGAYRAVRPGQVVLAFVRVERRGERIFGVPAEGDAISSLDWYVAGMPWFSGAEASARAGLWVRRESWATAGRSVRFIEGAGTTRAVAVDNAGAVLTPSTFGSAEYLADDWVLVDGGATEPAAVDITDLVFSGASARPFVVIGDRITDPGGGNPPGGGTPGTTPGTGTGSFPSSGEGFPYVRDGQVVRLVPARDLQTEAQWRP